MPTRWAWLAAAVLAMTAASGSAHAETFKCVDAKGRVTLSDTPCPPPPLPPASAPMALPCPVTKEQMAIAERLERQFLTRYPTEEAHRAAALAGLQEVVARMALSRRRLAELVEERKSIDDETEFYRGRPLPSALKSRLDASDALLAATAEVFRHQEDEIGVLVARFECDRSQFGMLWQGGAPGSSACAGACR